MFKIWSIVMVLGWLVILDHAVNNGAKTHVVVTEATRLTRGLL